MLKLKFFIHFLSVVYLLTQFIYSSFSSSSFSGEVAKEARAMAEHGSMPGFDRPPVIERLPTNVGKRKSTTPQKFVGEYVLYWPDVAEIIYGVL